MEPNQNPNQTPQDPQTPQFTPPPQEPQSFSQPPQEPDSSPFNAPPANPAPAKDKTNGFAIAGIIFAFLLPLIGLILSIIGLKKSKNYNGSGKSLSIVGIVISGILLLLSLLILPALIITTISSVQKRANEEKNNSVTQTMNSGLGDVYNEQSGAYSLKLPKGWRAEQNEGDRDTIALSQESSGDFVSTAVISTDEILENETLADIVKSELDTIKSQNGTIKSEKAITVNGNEGYEIIGSEGGNGVSAYEIYGVIVVKNNLVYRIAYATTPDLMNEYMPIFKASAQTFTVK